MGSLTSAEVYDPAARDLEDHRQALHDARAGHTATLLPNGKVLVAGGFDSSAILSSAEVYDPASGTWSATGSLATARVWPHGDAAAQWQGAGRGGVGSAACASAELYDPATGTWSATGRPEHGTLEPHGDAAAQWQGAGGGRTIGPAVS